MKAKDELLNLIEWRFLSHDTGEKNIEVNNAWAEDAVSLQMYTMLQI